MRHRLAAILTSGTIAAIKSTAAKTPFLIGDTYDPFIGD